MNILTQDWNGSRISFAVEDLAIAKFRIPKGYVNATQMCSSENKAWSEYRRLPKSIEYITALAPDLGLSQDELIVSISGGTQQGTWVHPEVAIDLGSWISIPFRIWINRQIQTLLQTGRVELPQPLSLADKLAQAKDAIAIAKDYRELFGAFNPQTEAYLKDIIGNVLMETNKLLGGTTELWMGVVNFAQVELDYTVPKKGEFRDSALGTWIRFYYPQLSDRQERRFCNETQRDIWVYPIHEIRNELTEAVHAFFSDTAPGTKLKLEGAFKRNK